MEIVEGGPADGRNAKEVRSKLIAVMVLTCRWHVQELLGSPGDVEDDDDPGAVVY